MTDDKIKAHQINMYFEQRQVNPISNKMNLRSLEPKDRNNCSRDFIKNLLR
jgi:hypothetical protein